MIDALWTQHTGTGGAVSGGRQRPERGKDVRGLIGVVAHVTFRYRNSIMERGDGLPSQH